MAGLHLASMRRKARSDDGSRNGVHSDRSTEVTFAMKPSGAAILGSTIVLARSAFDSRTLASHVTMGSRVSWIHISLEHRSLS